MGVRDPLRSARASLRRVAAAAVAALALASAWALLPVDHASTPPAEPSDESEPVIAAASPADLAESFRAPLWHAEPRPPPPPSPPPAAPPPEPPFQAQLLCIVREGDAFAAGFYDPGDQRVVFVRAGESIAGRSVDRVEERSVALRLGAAVKRLELPAAGGPP